MASSALQSKIGKREKAVLHVAKSQLGMTDEEYRGLLGSFGVASSVDLTHQQFDQVMERLEKAGFTRSSKPRQHKQVSGAWKGQSSSKAKMLEKVDALLADMGLPSSYADAIAKSTYGIEETQWLQPHQLRCVITRLYQVRKRREAKAAKEAGKDENS